MPASKRAVRQVRLQNEALIHQNDQIIDLINGLMTRIKQTGEGINDNLNCKFDHQLFPEVNKIAQTLDMHEAHSQILLWELFRKSGESGLEVRQRFFQSLPSARGTSRLLQQGCTQLLKEFDVLCRQWNIPYWLDFGALLGSIRHGGFFP